MEQIWYFDLLKAVVYIESGFKFNFFFSSVHVRCVFWATILTLIMKRGKYPLVMIGGGAQSAPPIFICENNRKSIKIMHCVEEIFFLSGSFEGKAIFHVILEIDR